MADALRADGDQRVRRKRADLLPRHADALADLRHVDVIARRKIAHERDNVFVAVAAPAAIASVHRRDTACPHQ